MDIIYSMLTLGGLGIVFGVLLSYSSKKFEVEVDPKQQAVQDALPGANCAGCGFPGCASFADAIVKGKAPINGCPVGGASTVAKLAAIMGVEAVATQKNVAYVRCNGTCDNAKSKYIYEGCSDCNMAAQFPGSGAKSCVYGCLGLATCKNVCPFDAIEMRDGLAVIIEDKCTSCGMCVSACPKKLIEIVPEASTVRVACISKDAGKVVKSNCSVGCIGCKICEKTCKYDAIHVENNIAHVDYSKCTLCKECVAKCPTKTIVS